MIKLFEVRIETPMGRYLNALIAADDEANARDIAVGMIEDFRGATSATFKEARSGATVAEIEIKEISTHAEASA